MLGSRKDGKIRIRCPECGKRLKFPSDKPGTILRCPICMHTLVAPLEGDEKVETVESVTKKAEQTIQQLKRMRGPAGGETTDKVAAWGTQSAVVQRNDSVSRLVKFLNAENDRVCGLAVNTIHDPTIAADQKEKRLIGLRQDKNNRVRREIDKIVRDLDEEIHRLTHHPLANQPTIKTDLQKRQEEKDGFFLYLRIIYGVKLVDTQKESINLDE